LSADAPRDRSASVEVLDQGDGEEVDVIEIEDAAGDVEVITIETDAEDESGDA
jgi:hypothetical protein